MRGLVAFLAYVAIGATVALSLHANGSQNQIAAPGAPLGGTGSLSGRVVDASSGQPIPGAMVLVIVAPVNPPAGGIRGANASQANLAMVIGGPGMGYASPQIVTDGTGSFVLRNLPAGAYTFETTAHGYSGGAYRQLQPDGPGQPIELSDGQHLDDIALPVWKDGAISGRVVDESGDPVVGVAVHVLRRVTLGGQASLQQTNSEATDDRGMYRVHGLTAGDYVVMVASTTATSPAAGTDSQAPGRAGGGGAGGRGGPGINIGDFTVSMGPSGTGAGLASPPPGADGKLLVYQTTFYPGATSSSQAATVSVTSGQDRSGVDLQLALTPTVRVSGTASEADGSPAVSLPIRLLPLDADQGRDGSPNSATTMSSGTGAFTLMGVPPGQYVLLAQRVGMRGRGAGPATTSDVDPSSWARVPVSVADTDVTGLALTLRAGFQVKGRLVFDGTTPQGDPSEQIGNRLVHLAPLAGTVAQCGTGRAGGVPPGPDGAFVVAGCLPGPYLLVPPPVDKWVLRTVTADGHDISDVPMELTNADITSVVATYTDRPAQVTGTVRTSSGDPDPKALVVLFSTDPHAWGWPSGVHRATSRSTDHGAFAVAHVPPGDYFVAAIPGDTPGDWNTPQLLQRLAARAARLHLSDNDHATQNLQTSVVK